MSEQEANVVPMRSDIDALLKEMYIGAMFVEDRLNLPPSVPASRLDELLPGREYMVLWRRLSRRQRILVEDVLPDEPNLPRVRYRVSVNDAIGRRFGPQHHLRFLDLADFEPVVAVRTSR